MLRQPPDRSFYGNPGKSVWNLYVGLTFSS
jgi:hypothetical protein